MANGVPTTEAWLRSTRDASSDRLTRGMAPSHRLKDRSNVRFICRAVFGGNAIYNSRWRRDRRDTRGDWAGGRMRTVSGVGILALAVAFATFAAALASADSPRAVRAQLRDAGLKPAPLYPTKLPARLRHSDAELQTGGGGFTVSFRRRKPFVDAYLRREDAGGVRRAKRDARAGGFKLRKLRLRGRRVYFVQTNQYGCYIWGEQRRSYFFCVKAGVTRKALRRAIQSMRPLRQEAANGGVESKVVAAKDASASARSCGRVRARGTRWNVRRTRGSVTCRRARFVARYVLTHGKGTQACAGRPPKGWRCAWIYGTAKGATGRIGPELRKARSALIAYPRGSRPYPSHLSGGRDRSPHRSSATLPAPASGHSAAGPGATWAAAAKARNCGRVQMTTYDGGSRSIRLRVRGRISCRGARRVSRRYDRRSAGGRGCTEAGGNACHKRIGSFDCLSPTAGSAPVVLDCSSRKLRARIKGYG